jgi:hypothetical protein
MNIDLNKQIIFIFTDSLLNGLKIDYFRKYGRTR